MAKPDIEWVKSQLTQARVPKAVGDTVLTLLETWDGIEIPENLTSQALDIFKDLARGYALVEERSEETWVQAQAGFIKVTDEVRVRRDAFSGKAGALHNGRRGKIIAIRSGDVIMRSTDDREPFLDGVHYPVIKLEKRVR